MGIKDLHKILEQQLKDTGNIEHDEIQKKLNMYRELENKRPVLEFEGYSPSDMHNIMYCTFDAFSPIKLQTLKNEEYLKIPIFNQIRYLAEIINREGEIKLTDTGNLPVKVVKELYEQGFIKEKQIEAGWVKLINENDASSIKLTKLLIQQIGITKKRNNKLSLTKNSNSIINDYDLLFRLIFFTYTSGFNWAFFDGYGDHNIGKLAFGFSLILISKYGNEQQIDTFYAEKYITAFPALLDKISHKEYRNLKEEAYSCYSLRTFDHFLDYFGLIKIEEEGSFLDCKKYITKTELFDKLIEIRNP